MSFTSLLQLRSVRPPRSLLRTGFRLSTILFAAGIAGCNSISNLTMRPDAPPPAGQQRLGSRAYHHHVALFPPIEDAEATKIVADVGTRLASASGRDDLPWEFVLTLDPAVRVRAFPGGRVVVSDGMLAACQSEAQLAAVMAHEIGHMLAGHSIPQMAPHNSAAQSDPSSHPDDFRPSASHDAHSHPEGYSLHQEEEADSIALSLLVHAGYDPEVVRSIWLAQGNHNDQLSANLQRHPLDHNRRISLMETLSQAKQVYRSHSDPRGTGEAIVYTARAPREPLVQIADTSSPSTDVWTPADQRGGAKPSGWNADLAEAEWLPPADDEHTPVETVIQVEHEWTALDRDPTDVEQASEQTGESAPTDGPMLLPVLRDDLQDAGLRSIE